MTTNNAVKRVTNWITLAPENKPPYEAIGEMIAYINLLETCLYSCIEEGGVGSGWEVNVDHATGHAWPENDPSED